MEEMVQIPVPKKYLLEIYAYIGGLEKAPEGQKQREVADALGAAPSEEWTPELLHRAWNESQAPMRNIFKRLAESPDEPVTASELAKAIRPDPTKFTLGGTLGAFGRRCKSRYGVIEWPFKVQWNYTAGMWEYVMSKRIAEQVRSYYSS
jgi:hypothetical protein